MSRPWVRVLWWVCCLTFIVAAAFGGRLEDATGLPIGPGSLLLLLLFAAYRGIDWYVYRQEHPEYPMAPTGPEPQTVEMALQRLEAKRAKVADVTGAATESNGPRSRTP